MKKVLSLIGSIYFLLVAISELTTYHSILWFILFLAFSIICFILYYRLRTENIQALSKKVDTNFNKLNSHKTTENPVELARTKYILPKDIEDCIVKGISYSKCRILLQQKAEFSQLEPKELKELISTAGTRILNENQAKQFQEDFKYYRISSCKDCCSICKEVSSKKFKFKDRQVGINFPPFHLGCRCSFIVEIDSDFADRYERNHKR